MVNVERHERKKKYINFFCFWCLEECVLEVWVEKKRKRKRKVTCVCSVQEKKEIK